MESVAIVMHLTELACVLCSLVTRVGRRLQQRVEEIKRDGRAQEYDAVMGVSGGVDSSYAALIAKEEGLRILAVHCDSGWNSGDVPPDVEFGVAAAPWPA